jgi:hypothetical protein
MTVTNAGEPAAIAAVGAIRPIQTVIGIGR